MDAKTLHGMWNYFLTLERDLDNTSRYIEPSGQENVYSFEFAKLLILACTEVESAFKAMCFEIEKSQVSGDIGVYKATILGKYPKIIDSEVSVDRLGKNIKPFVGWDTGPLLWWGAYQNVKHNRGAHFLDATYLNATTALAALYILIFYLAQINGINFSDTESSYISSAYMHPILSCQPSRKLPDFTQQS